MTNKNLFEKQEALAYLLEDNEISLFELDTEIKMLKKYDMFASEVKRFKKFDQRFDVVRAVNESLERKCLLQTEQMRENINRQLLLSEVNKL